MNGHERTFQRLRCFFDQDPNNYRLLVFPSLSQGPLLANPSVSATLRKFPESCVPLRMSRRVAWRCVSVRKMQTRIYEYSCSIFHRKLTSEKWTYIDGTTADKQRTTPSGCSVGWCLASLFSTNIIRLRQRRERLYTSSL